MKIIVQDRRTLLFMGASGRWVKNEEEARFFPDSASALRYCMEQQLSNVQILLGLNRDVYCLRLKIGDHRDKPFLPALRRSANPVRQAFLR